MVKTATHKMSGHGDPLRCGEPVVGTACVLTRRACATFPACMVQLYAHPREAPVCSPPRWGRWPGAEVEDLLRRQQHGLGGRMRRDRTQRA